MASVHQHVSLHKLGHNAEFQFGKHHPFANGQGMGCKGVWAGVLRWSLCQPHVISAENKWDYQLTIQDDPLLSVLAEMIIAGRPDGIKDVPKALWPYHGQCDGLILSASTEQDSVSTGLTSTKILNDLLMHAPLVKNINLRNQSNNWSQHHLNDHGNT